MVVIVKENKDGKIELTKEELEQIIEDAQSEGRRENPIWVAPYPSVPSTTPYWYSIEASSNASDEAQKRPCKP